MRSHVAVLTMLAPMLAVVLTVPPASASTCAPEPDRPGTRAPLAAIPAGVSPAAAETRIRWTAWSLRVLVGEPALLRGQVVTDDGAIGDAEVELFARAAGASEWTASGVTRSDPETGVFAFDCLEPATTTDYRVAFAGSLTFQGSRGQRTVQVMRRVPDALRQVGAELFRLSGRVQPRYADRPVLLQQRDCRGCRWHTVARRQTDGRSRWAFSVSTSDLSGSRWLRAAVPADESFARSYGQHVWRIAR